jgi:hypothetical protein
LGSFYTAIVRRPLNILDSTREFSLNTTAVALDIPANYLVHRNEWLSKRRSPGFLVWTE